MSDTKFLSIRDLCVEYSSNKEIIHAVNGVSLDLEKGKTLGLVGETGAGKTTIARAILQILPERSAKIKSGKIFLEGENLLDKSEDEMLKIRGNKISMIFQDPMTALNPVMTVGEQICEALVLHTHMSESEANEEANRMLEMVGIPASRAGDYPHQFSGGMKQRVVIAMALACRPDLLLADEPTTALDVTIQAQVLEMIANLQNELHTAMMLITHDLGVVAEVCDDVAVIYAGEIVEYGTKEDIFLHPTHPYTKGLFDSLPSLTDDAEYLKPIVGMPPDPRNLPEGCSFHPRCPKACDLCKKGDIPLTQIGEHHFCRCCQIEESGDK